MDEDTGDERAAALTQAVADELLALRGSQGQLTIQKFSGYPTLVRVCGADDLLDAFLMFRRELTRYKNAGRDEAAAAWSLSAEADTVLDRLQLAADHVSPVRERDQRTARRWSDAGIPRIADDLVYFARMRGRLGSELLSIELSDDQIGGLKLTIDQMTSRDLEAVAPEMSIWRYDLFGEPREATVDLSEFGSTSAFRADYVMRRHRVALELPEWFGDAQALEGARQAVGDDELKLLTVTLTGRDAPMRTVRVPLGFTLARGLAAEATVHRSVCAITVSVTSSDPRAGY